MTASIRDSTIGGLSADDGKRLSKLTKLTKLRWTLRFRSWGGLSPSREGVRGRGASGSSSGRAYRRMTGSACRS